MLNTFSFLFQSSEVVKRYPFTNESTNKVSSELELDALEIIDKYHGLTRLEDQFREMKSTLDTRPIFVNTQEHIHAHLLICFMALTILRIIQFKLKKALPENTEKAPYWSYGIPGSRIAKALLDWQVEQLNDEFFRMVNVTSDDLRAILDAFSFSISFSIQRGRKALPIHQ